MESQATSGNAVPSHGRRARGMGACMQCVLRLAEVISAIAGHVLLLFDTDHVRFFSLHSLHFSPWGRLTEK
jgi:hypothetical protein